MWRAERLTKNLQFSIELRGNFYYNMLCVFMYKGGLDSEGNAGYNLSVKDNSALFACQDGNKIKYRGVLCPF